MCQPRFDNQTRRIHQPRFVNQNSGFVKQEVRQPKTADSSTKNGGFVNQASTTKVQQPKTTDSSTKVRQPKQRICQPRSSSTKKTKNGGFVSQGSSITKTADASTKARQPKTLDSSVKKRWIRQDSVLSIHPPHPTPHPSRM